MMRYVDQDRARTQKHADSGTADRPMAARDHAPAGDPLGGSLNETPRSRALTQLSVTRDASPRVQSQLALQRALNQRGPVPAGAAEASKRKKPAPLQKKPNATGLPDHLKAGVENLSGLALDDVRVHYNSSKPAALQAHAYTQGAEIHVASGQEKHLPHEAWHVVQQKQGRVTPTLQLKDTAINDDAALEREADVMGARSLAEQGLEQTRERHLRLGGDALGSRQVVTQRQPLKPGEANVDGRIKIVITDPTGDTVEIKVVCLAKEYKEGDKFVFFKDAKLVSQEQNLNPQRIEAHLAFPLKEKDIRIKAHIKQALEGAPNPYPTINVPGWRTIRTEQYTEQELKDMLIEMVLSGIKKPLVERVQNEISAVIEARKVRTESSSKETSSSEETPEYPPSSKKKLSSLSLGKAKRESKSPKEKPKSRSSRGKEQGSPSLPEQTPQHRRSGEESLRHFVTRDPVLVTLTEGMLADPDTGEKMSQEKRLGNLKKLGIGQHEITGHIGVSIADMKSQAANDKRGTFSWASDAALLDAVKPEIDTFHHRRQKNEKGELPTAEDKKVKIKIPFGAGFGVVKSTDGSFFQVWPKWAVIVAKKEGDFKTAYGLTEVKEKSKFEDAYYKWDALEGAKKQNLVGIKKENKSILSSRGRGSKSSTSTPSTTGEGYGPRKVDQPRKAMGKIGGRASPKQEGDGELSPVAVMVRLGRATKGALYIMKPDDWPVYEQYKKDNPHEKYSQ